MVTVTCQNCNEKTTFEQNESLFQKRMGKQSCPLTHHFLGKYILYQQNNSQSGLKLNNICPSTFWNWFGRKIQIGNYKFLRIKSSWFGASLLMIAENVKWKLQKTRTPNITAIFAGRIFFKLDPRWNFQRDSAPGRNVSRTNVWVAESSVVLLGLFVVLVGRGAEWRVVTSQTGRFAVFRGFQHNWTR